MPAQHCSGNAAMFAARQHCATHSTCAQCLTWKLLHDWLLLQKHNSCRILHLRTKAGVRSRAAPTACTVSYAAPEMLLAFQLADLSHSKTNTINGAAADMWAAGCTLYRMLTGKLPFNMHDTGPFKHRWEKFRAAHRVQESWVSTQTHLVHMPPDALWFAAASRPFLLCCCFHCAALKM